MTVEVEGSGTAATLTAVASDTLGEEAIPAAMRTPAESSPATRRLLKLKLFFVPSRAAFGVPATSVSGSMARLLEAHIFFARRRARYESEGDEI